MILLENCLCLDTPHSGSCSRNSCFLFSKMSFSFLPSSGGLQQEYMKESQPGVATPPVSQQTGAKVHEYWRPSSKQCSGAPNRFLKFLTKLRPSSCRAPSPQLLDSCPPDG
eukprot:TRINITY_DN10174_c0_g1_i1.p1 TRINITY_DN10174_c0_g1~~TRINITY_DN10174_c0_g1_i1.p1  ORF type:complete len:111 (-),score=9.95 TRINITY_DN10174_c0_g1_i1:147-479(-)